MDRSEQERLFWGELHDLILARENGALSEAGQQRLEELVTSNPALCEIYAHYLLQTASLRDWAATRKLSGIAPQADKAQVLARSPLLRFLDKLPKAIQPARHPVRFFSVAALLTTVFWVAVALIVLPRGEGPGQQQGGWTGPARPFDAKIVRLQNAIWADRAQQPRVGTILPRPQSFELRQGLVQLLFGDGAMVVLAGPARFAIDSAGAMTLERGKLLARADADARGFIVRTPVVQVVDLGTEFGLDVLEAETEVQVFTGKVEVRRADQLDARPRELSANQAAAFGNSPQGFYVKEKKMNRAMYLALAATLSLPVAERAWSNPIPPLTFTSANYWTGGGASSLGYEFTPNVDILVTHLGYYDHNGDGLAASSEVGIFAVSSQSLVSGASVTVPAGGALPLGGLSVGPAGGVYRYQELATSVLLTANTTYRIAGTTEASNANGYTYGGYGALTVDSNITLGNGYAVNGAGLNYLSNINGNPGNMLVGGGSFLFTLPAQEEALPVPEPTSGAALGLGGWMLFGLARRRRGKK